MIPDPISKQQLARLIYAEKLEQAELTRRVARAQAAARSGRPGRITRVRHFVRQLALALGVSR